MISWTAAILLVLNGPFSYILKRGINILKTYPSSVYIDLVKLQYSLHKRTWLFPNRVCTLSARLHNVCHLTGADGAVLAGRELSQSQHVLCTLSHPLLLCWPSSVWERFLSRVKMGSTDRWALESEIICNIIIHPFFCWRSFASLLFFKLSQL